VQRYPIFGTSSNRAWTIFCVAFFRLYIFMRAILNENSVITEHIQMLRDGKAMDFEDVSPVNLMDHGIP